MVDEEIKESLIEEDKYLILKGRFKSNAMSFYGIFLLIFNGRREMVVCHSIISTYSSIYDNEPDIGWEKYQEFIVNAKWKGNFNPSMSASLQNLLNRLNPEKLMREELFENIKNNNYEVIGVFMFDTINKIILDKNLIIETGIQEVTEEEYNATKEATIKTPDTESASAGFKTEEGAVILPIKLILAPVSGKPIYELKIGDRIMTKIAPNSDQANYYIDLLGLRIEDRIKAVPSIVTEIKSENRGDPLEILVHLGQGIYGSCIEDERQVKLRMYDPATDGAIFKGAQKDRMNMTPEKILNLAGDIQQSIPRITFIMGGLLVIILLILLILIIYM